MEQKQKKYLYVIYMVRYLRHLRHSRCHKSGTEKNFYIYINIYINLPKLGFCGNTVPFHAFLQIFYYCIFFVLKCRICRFCRIYIHTGEK